MRRTVASLVVFTVLVVACLFAWTGSAFAFGGTGTIAGTVTDSSTGAPIEGIAVGALYDTGFGWSYDDNRVTDSNGDYSLVNLQAFPMRIEFYDPAGQYFMEYYDDQAEWSLADSVPVGEGTYTGGIDAQLEPGAFIEGSVVDTATGDPIANVWVTPLYWDGWWWQNACVPAQTGADGTYSVGPLHAGSYPVRFQDPSGHYFLQYYDRVATLEDALYVGVAAGATVGGVNARLEEAKAITGTVRDETTGDPIGGVEVSVWRLLDGYYWDEFRIVNTASDGTYYAGPLDDGVYLVSYSDLSFGRYLGEFWDDKPDKGSANEVAVAGGSVSSIDASLTPAGSIAGHVTDAATSDPADSVYVQVYSQDSVTGDWYLVGQKYTDNLGDYEIGSIPAGPVKVQFMDFLGRYAQEWFNDQPFLHRSDVSVVTAGGTTTGVNAALAPAGSIGGRIYDRWTGDPAYGYVYLYDAMDGLGELYEVSWVDTPDGDYLFEGLPEWSDYVVAVDPPGPMEMRYYDDTGSPLFATPIGVWGDDVTGIDIPLDITPDTTAPGVGDDALAVYYNSASIEITATDDLSGVAAIEYRFDAEATVTVEATTAVVATSAEGVHTLGYVARDNAGNVSEPVVREFDVVYDTTPPELSYGGGEPYQSVPQTTMSMYATDDVSGVARLYWRSDGGATQTVDADFYHEVFAGDGPHTLVFWADDLAGNVSDPLTLEFFLDQVAPGASEDAGDFYDTTPVTFTVTGDDGAEGSGVDFVRYRVDGGVTQTVDASSADVVVGGEGTHSVEYWAVDMAGNQSGHGTADFTIDLTDPVITHDGADPPRYPRTARITVEADDGGSRLATLSWQLDAGAVMVVDGPANHLEDVVDAAVGSHMLHIWAEDRSGNTAEETFEFDVVEPEALRVADRTRYSTAVEIAREAFDPDGDRHWEGVGDETQPHIIIASGEDRAAADPLAASGLCWAYDAPLFLVSSTGVSTEVKVAVKEIADSYPGEIVKVHIVGGPASVPDARYSELASYVGSARLAKHRLLSTGGRYDMAAAIAREMKKASGTTPKTVLIANGADATKFFDALALSPISAGTGRPILLVSATSVPPATESVIGEFDPTRIVIGGGPNTVTSAVKSRLKVVSGVTPEQWYLGSRYTTAMKIADNAVAAGWLTRANVGIAAKLPDALTGGSMVGMRRGVLLITDGSALTRDVGTWLEAHDAEIGDCYIFGGVNSVANSVIAAIDAKLNMP